MSLVSRGIEVAAGGLFVWGGVQGLMNTTEYLGTVVHDNDVAKQREHTTANLTNIGRFAMDNVTMTITGLDTLGVPFIEANDANREVMSNTATGDVIGLTIGYGGSLVVLATGIGLVGIGVTGRQVFDQSPKVTRQLHA